VDNVNKTLYALSIIVLNTSSGKKAGAAENSHTRVFSSFKLSALLLSTMSIFLLSLYYFAGRKMAHATSNTSSNQSREDKTRR
jgi:hypothetical protein